METKNKSLGLLFLEKAYGKWWMMLVEGLIFLILSGITLFNPEITIKFIVYIIGVSRIVVGLIYLILVIASRMKYGAFGGFSIVRGVSDIFIGLIFCLSPNFIVSFFMLLIGFFALIIGAIILFFGFNLDGGWKWSTIILGGLIACFAIFALFNPLDFAEVFILILGFVFGVSGIFLMIRSFAVKKKLEEMIKLETGFTDYKVEE